MFTYLKAFFSLWKCLENFMNITFSTFCFHFQSIKYSTYYVTKSLIIFCSILFCLQMLCCTIKRVVQRNLFCHYCTNRKVTFFLLFIVVANTSQPGNVDLRIFAEFNGIKEKRREPLHPHRTSFVLSFFWRKKTFELSHFWPKFMNWKSIWKSVKWRIEGIQSFFLFHRCRACWDYN